MRVGAAVENPETGKRPIGADVALDRLQSGEELGGEDAVERRPGGIEQQQPRRAVGAEDVRIRRRRQRIGVAIADRLAGDEREAERVAAEMLGHLAAARHRQDLLQLGDRGRGEVVEPLRLASRFWFVIARPPSGLSTAEVYRHCRPSPIARLF